MTVHEPVTYVIDVHMVCTSAHIVDEYTPEVYDSTKQSFVELCGIQGCTRVARHSGICDVRCNETRPRRSRVRLDDEYDSQTMEHHKRRRRCDWAK